MASHTSLRHLDNQNSQASFRLKVVTAKLHVTPGNDDSPGGLILSINCLPANTLSSPT